MRALKGDVEAFNDLDLMNNLYARYLDLYPNDITPIIFVLTKADLGHPRNLKPARTSFAITMLHSLVPARD